ncbi:MAG: hypothetical protein V7K89_24830 [Nostoc sp.]
MTHPQNIGSVSLRSAKGSASRTPDPKDPLMIRLNFLQVNPMCKS